MEKLKNMFVYIQYKIVLIGNGILAMKDSENTPSRPVQTKHR